MHRATIEIEVQRPIRVTFVQQRRHVAFNRVNSPANLSFGGLLFVAFYVVVFELFVLEDEEFGKPAFEGHYPLLRLLLQPPLQRKQHGRLTYHLPRLFPFKCFSHHSRHLYTLRLHHQLFLTFLTLIILRPLLLEADFLIVSRLVELIDWWLYGLFARFQERELDRVVTLVAFRLFRLQFFHCLAEQGMSLFLFFNVAFLYFCAEVACRSRIFFDYKTAEH